MDGKLRNMSSIYISQGDKMLLLYRQGSRVVNDVWVGSAGGHFEEYELNDSLACIIRELQEELNITQNMLDDIKLRYITLRRTKGEIRQNYYFFAELKSNINIHQFSSNEGILKWFEKKDLTTLEMPFSSKYVIKHYLNIGICNDKLYGGIADGEKVVFIELPEF